MSCCNHTHSPAGGTDPGAPSAIQVDQLRVQFDGVRVLNGVSLSIPQGELVALIGPNGSGKTTLLRCLLGLQKPSSGDIALFGQKDLAKALPRVGYVPQKLELERNFSLSVREFLALRLPRTRNWFWKSSAWLDTELMEDLVPLGVDQWMGRPLANLSGGQLQRVLIAFSLLHRPDLLLLDEPTAGVDLPGEQSFYDLIGEVHRSRKITVVLVSHDLSMVYRHASRVYALNGVICCEGSPEEVMNAESLKEAYGIHVSPYHHHHHEGHPHSHPSPTELPKVVKSGGPLP